MSSSQVPSKVHTFSIMSAGSAGTNVVYEVVEHVASEMSSSLALAPAVVPHDSSSTGTQDGDDDGDHANDIRINIDPTTATDELRPDMASPVQLSRALWTMALLTLVIDVGTALYRPARGVLFGRSRLAYYVTLAAIFVAGVAEAFAAFWLSRRFHHADEAAVSRSFSSGRACLCASIGPFVAVVGISGFTFIEG